MRPALAYWMFFSIMARAWSIPAPKPEPKRAETIYAPEEPQ